MTKKPSQFTSKNNKIIRFRYMPARSKPQMGEFIPSYQHRFWHLLIFFTDSKLCYLYATKAEVFFFSTTHRENWHGLYKNITEHFAALVRHLVTCHKCPVQEINPTHQYSRPNWVCMGFIKKCPRFILSAAGTQQTASWQFSEFCHSVFLSAFNGDNL